VLEKRTKIVVLIFLLFVLVAACTLITSGPVKLNSSPTPKKNGQVPIREVDVTLAQNQHDQLFEQLRKFADKYAFAIRISQTAEPPGENFLVQMWREDIKVTALDSGEHGLFLIFFYNTYDERPVPLSVFDELIVNLKGFIGEIPNTTFTIKE
jgi:hypothetical protein